MQCVTAAHNSTWEKGDAGELENNSKGQALKFLMSKEKFFKMSIIVIITEQNHWFQFLSKETLHFQRTQVVIGIPIALVSKKFLERRPTTWAESTAAPLGFCFICMSNLAVNHTAEFPSPQGQSCLSKWRRADFNPPEESMSNLRAWTEYPDVPLGMREWSWSWDTAGCYDR